MKQKKGSKKCTFRTSEVAFLVITTCVLSFVMAFLIFRKNDISLNEQNNEVLSEFIKQYENIVNNYYGTVNEQKLLDGAIKGMISSLDDSYATYFDSNEARNFNIKLDGEFEGMGVEIIKTSDNKIEVLTVYDDSPAAKSGLKVGDIIVSLNDLDVSNISTEDFVGIVTKNKKAKIVVERNGKNIEFNISTSNITIKSVASEIFEKNNSKIGYIKIDIFALNTYDQFKRQLSDLESKGIDSLIIDLRSNSGGHLSTAEEILSLFLSKQRVIYQIKKKGGIEKFYSDGNADKKYPIVILVNNESASASEIVTAALREHLNVTVIGQKTYGKGTAQELVTLSSGEQYKFTTKEWLTPSGKIINNNGIVPDIQLDDQNMYIDKAIEVLSK